MEGGSVNTNYYFLGTKEQGVEEEVSRRSPVLVVIRKGLKGVKMVKRFKGSPN